MACSMPPIYWSTGSHWSTALRSVGAVAIQGSVKRAKYQDESTKGSMVSVSRRAGPPQLGQVLGRHRHHPAGLAMDDRDRTAPIALPRNAPVAQPEIHLALCRRTIAAHVVLEPTGDFLLRLRDGHAVEEA